MAILPYSTAHLFGNKYMANSTSLHYILVLVSVLSILALSGCSTTPDNVFAKYLEATNPSKIPRPKSLMLKAKMSEESAFSARTPVTPDQLLKASSAGVRLHTVTIYCEYPDKIYLNGEAALVAPNGTGLGTKKVADVFVKRVFDGQNGWEVTSSPQSPSAGGTRDLKFYEVDKLRKMVDGAFAINVLENVEKPKYLGEQTVEYNDPESGSVVKANAHVIEAFATGGRKQTLYFDRDSGLLIKVEEVDPLSNARLTSIMANYKQFGSVRMPSKIKMMPTGGEGPNEPLLLTIEELVFDAPQPEGAFVKPS